MSKIRDMIVIGGGPAGYTAALYAARAGMDVLVIEKMSAGGQMALTDIIDNYPGFEEGIDGFTLAMRMQSGAEHFGAQTEYAEVIEVDLQHGVKRVVTAVGEHLAHTVVIATGADPRELGIKDEQALVGRGLHYCAHCDGRFYKEKTVMVVGGGNSAVSDALYLSRLAQKVYLVHRRDTLRATENTGALLGADNVTFLWNSTVSDYVVDGRVTGAIVKHVQDGSEQQLAVDGIFVSIGRRPNSALFGNALALDSSGYIIADETTRTSIEGVYAVGDVRQKPLRQVVTAAADGAVAVHFAQDYLARLTQA